MAHRFSLLQYRMQIAALLAVLIAIIVANGIATKRHMDRMNTAVTSMYEDRLLASSYLFDMANYIHHLQANNLPTPDDKNNHKAVLKTLIEKYGQTTLTQQEALIWDGFKKDLKAYDNTIAQGIASDTYLTAAADKLNQLEQIQSSEGKILFQSLNSEIKASFLRYSLEMVTAVVIGIVALGLIGISRNRFMAPPKGEHLN